MRDKEQSEIGANQPSRIDAQEVVRDWEFLFWAFLAFGLGRLVWMYFARPENSSFHLGLSCGFVFCGTLGFAMRWALNPTQTEDRRN